MSTKNWIILVIALALLLLVVAVPAAYLLARNWPQPEATPVAVLPTQEEPTRLPVTIVVATTTAPTATPESTATLTLTPTETVTPSPTSTPTQTYTPTPVTPTLTPTPTIACNWAQFVSDLDVPDGSFFGPGDNFFKSWRIKNIGSCTWTTAYSLAFSSGTAMTVNNLVVPLPGTVKPGETIDVTVKLVSPNQPGSYTGFWMLEDKSGFAFGQGPQAATPFDVKIQVLNVDKTAEFDFILDLCNATWRDSNGNKLACPSSPTGGAGFVTVLANPVMEHRTENEPAIWINPDHRGDGKLTGTYPAYSVRDGDHFRAWVGCLADSQGCNVTFEFSRIRPNGNIEVLGTWTEKFDGEVSVIDIDLSWLADRDVVFILSVAINNDKYNAANAFWFMPRIVNLEP